MTAKLKPIHPGEILREEFMKPLNLNPNKLALDLHVYPPTVYDIVREKRDISPLMALRLGRYFGTTPEFWLNLQSRYNLEVSRDKQQRIVEQQVRPLRRVLTHA
jgi:addiction module HigA family antidote